MKLKYIARYFSELFSGERKLKLHFEKEVFSFDVDKIPLIELSNNAIYKNLITIDGSGASGSSAVTDFLAEFLSCTVLGGVDARENPERGIENQYEVDFFRDVNGLQELEKICYSNNKRIKCNAINNYLRLIATYYKKNHAIYNDFFLSATKKFILDIVDFVNIYKDGTKEYYPKELTVSAYRTIANNYIHRVLESIPSKDNLVLDAAMSINEPNIKLLTDYWGNFKLIYVWRDPRDIYVTGRNLDDCDWIPKDPEIFVKWYLRDCPKYIEKKDNSLLTIRFEDFVFNYENVTKQIVDFIGTIKSEEHIYRK